MATEFQTSALSDASSSSAPPASSCPPSPLPGEPVHRFILVGMLSGRPASGSGRGNPWLTTSRSRTRSDPPSPSSESSPPLSIGLELSFRRLWGPPHAALVFGVGAPADPFRRDHRRRPHLWGRRAERWPRPRLALFSRPSSFRWSGRPAGRALRAGDAAVRGPCERAEFSSRALSQASPRSGKVCQHVCSHRAGRLHEGLGGPRRCLPKHQSAPYRARAFLSITCGVIVASLATAAAGLSPLSSRSSPCC